MGQGYTRQSAADIVAGQEIQAGPLNSEFNQIEAAFNNTTGHTHDGTIGEGPLLDFATSITGVDDLLGIEALAGTSGGLFKTAANTWALRTLAGTANQITMTNGDGVAGAPTISLPSTLILPGTLQVTGATILPVTDDGTAIGSTTKQFSDLFIAVGGVINWNAGDVTITGTSNTLTFAGATSGYSFDDDILLPTSGSVINFNAGDVLLTHSSNTLTLSGVGNTTGGFIIDTGSTASAVGIRITNTDDGANVAANLDFFKNSATPAASDNLSVIRFKGNSSTLVERAYASFYGSIVSATNGAEEGQLTWAVSKAGTNSATLQLTSSALSPAVNDGITLGTSSFTFSDLFLASGGVINWNNGNYTMTHSAGLLTTNGSFAIGAASNPNYSISVSGVQKSSYSVATANGAFALGTVSGDGVLRTTGGALFFDTNTGSGNPSLSITGGNGAVILGVGQLKFPATQNASSDANTLDDYEEGTTNPTVTSSSGSFTSVNCVLYYVKIGRVVTAFGQVNVTTLGTAAGTIIVPMPFTAFSDSSIYPNGQYYNRSTGATQGRAIVVPGSTSLLLNTASGGFPTVGDAQVLNFSVTYMSTT